MKRFTPFAFIAALTLIVIGSSILGVSSTRAASVGVIDPSSAGRYKAKFLTPDLGSGNLINFGKFTTQSVNNITVTDSELRGYAWGNGVGWMVMNCLDTTSGCSTTNGNFKVANDGYGLLSGYAWGENTGWINFGPFTNTAISRVKINENTGYFEGTLGSAGYAWSQNFGWIIFDCTDVDACTETDWRRTVVTPPPAGGGGGGAIILPPTRNPDPTPDPTPDPDPIRDPNPPRDPDPIRDPNPPRDPNPIPDPTPDPTPDPDKDPTPDPQPDAPPDRIVGPPGRPSGPTDFVASDVAVGAPFLPFLKWLRLIPESLSRWISAIGITIALAAPIIIAALHNPFSLYDIGLLIARLWSLLLIAFGLKRRNPPWGTVYDSSTKQPLDPVYVVLSDLAGNEIASAITDIDGRYGFAVPAGTYTISARKTNYQFPSEKLQGKRSDELYEDLYFGDQIVVTEDDSIIAKNIPMDQLNFDWNEYAKNAQNRLHFFKQRELLIRRIADTLFVIGFIISFWALVQAQTLYNVAIIAVYVFLAVARVLKIGIRPKGTVFEKYTNQPLGYAIVRVSSQGTGQEIAHRVANQMGQYYCLLQNGSYNVKIDRKLPDGTYQSIPAKPVTVTTGHLNETFEV